MFEYFEKEMKETLENTSSNNYDLPEILDDNRWSVIKDYTRLFGVKKVDGIRYGLRFKDKNGLSDYGVSIIKRPGSIGYEYDKWEIALLFKGNVSHRIEDDFCLHDNVIGYLNNYEVKEWVEKFYKLYIMKDKKIVAQSKLNKLYLSLEELDRYRDDLKHDIEECRKSIEALN